MNWIDTHIHIAGALPDGTPKPNLTQAVADVLNADEDKLHLVVNCCEATNAYEYARMKEDPAWIIEGSRHIHQLTQELPGRILGASVVNPFFLDESLRVMDTVFGEWGFVMLGEMIQYLMLYRMDSDPVERLVRRAAEFDVPVHVHISTSNSAQGNFTSGTEELYDFLGLVQRVPEAKYILAHFIGSPRVDPTNVETYVDIIERELGGWPRTFWGEIIHFHSPGLPVALARIPHDRLIVGTDWVATPGPPFLPYGIVYGIQDPDRNPYPPKIASYVDFIRQAGASEETIQAIAWGNTAALLKIE